MARNLIVYDGFEIPTEFGYRKIIGKHYDNFAVDDYAVDEDGNEQKIGEAILTHREIKNAMHEATGESYDLCLYNWDRTDDEETEEE